MRTYIEKYIQCCVPCLYAKSLSGRKPGYLHSIEKHPVPFHTIHIDHLGPFDKTPSKNEHIIVVIDAFTKFCLLKAVRSTKTKYVIKFLEESFNTYGTPARIIDDRGTFASKEFQSFCKKYGIRQILNAVATPRANGQVERLNRTILSSLTACTESDKWDREIAKVQFSINNTVHRVLKKTPSELLMGYRPTAMSESVLTHEVSIPAEVREDLVALRMEAQKKIKADQEKAKVLFDKKRKKPKLYKEGDLVLIQKNLYAEGGKSKKLLQKFSGPMVIKRVLPNDRYYVEDPPGMLRSKTRRYKNVISIDRMKDWVPPGALSDDTDSNSCDDQDGVPLPNDAN